MKFKKVLGWFLLFCIIPISGCGDKRILEDLGFIQTISYDSHTDDKVAISFSIPQTDPETTSNREVLSAVASSSKDAKMIVSRKSGMMLVSGQIRNVLFGQSLAEQGIHGHLDALFRDPSISPQVKISVVEGDAGELLLGNYKQHPRTGRYIDMLLAKEALGQTIPKVTLFNFARDYFDEGIDPVAPILKKQADNYIMTNGVALFKDDRYVTKIEPSNALVFAFLRGKFKEGHISIEMEGPHNDKEIVMFSSLISSRKIKVKHGADGIEKITFRVNVSGSVLEYIGKSRLSNDRDRHELEKRISEKITQKANDVISLMKQHQVDSIGIGQYIRNSVGYHQWKQMNWRQELQNLRVECSFDIKIKDYGKLK